MRVIAGMYKGRTLFSPKGKAVRPTSDRVKETMFNILYSKDALQDAAVLDLFCGSGALGIEALSRGARSLTCVDNEKESVDLTKQNLAKVCKEGGSATVVQNDVFFALKYFAKNAISFDLILMDPPYSGAYETRVLQAIFETQIISPTGILVLESATDSCVDLPSGCLLIDERKIGKTTLRFLQRGNQ